MIIPKAEDSVSLCLFKIKGERRLAKLDEPKANKSASKRLVKLDELANNFAIKREQS